MTLNSTTSPKVALRHDLKAARSGFVAGLSAADRSALESALAAQIAPHLTPEQRIASYAAFGSEIDPAQFSALHTVLLPRVAGAGVPLTFHEPGTTPLIDSRFGVAEPPPGLPDIDPDVVLVPLLGVDRRGHRIGYGAGHYDRTLAALRQRRRILAIGCAWDCQLIDEVPAEAWDETLDAVVTPTRWLAIRC